MYPGFENVGLLQCFHNNQLKYIRGFVLLMVLRIDQDHQVCQKAGNSLVDTKTMEQNSHRSEAQTFWTELLALEVAPLTLELVLIWFFGGHA